MLEQDLQDVGLNEKEAKVYLASLEIGQSVVQDIAKKAGVNRATTYFVIEALMRMGLMSSFHKDRKQYFVAADPDRLADILEQEKASVEKKENDFKKLLPQLKSVGARKVGGPVVKYYEGKEGIKAMVEEIMQSTKGATVNMAYSVDEVNKIFGDEEKAKWVQKRKERKIKTKVIYTFRQGIKKSDAHSDRRKVPHDKFPISCDIAVFENKVRIASLKGRLVGIIIEDREIAKSLKAILDLAWEGAEKYQKE